MKKVTKKQRKLLRGGNAMVMESLKLGSQKGEYIGEHNIPWVKPELHNL